MIISRCVPLYQQKKKGGEENRGINAAHAFPRVESGIYGFLLPYARSRGKLGSLSVSVVSPVPQKGRRILLNNSSAFDPAIISALCFCHAIWARRDGPLFYLSPREIDASAECASLGGGKKSLTPDEFNYSFSN